MDPFGHRLSTRARFFHGLAAALDAGLPVDQAILTCAPEDHRWQDLGNFLAQEIRGGRSLTDGFRRHADAHGRLLPERERVILEAGERSGRLPHALKHLANHLEQAAQVRRGLAGKLAYPILLIHAAIVLPTLPIVVQSGFAEYLQTVGLMLALLYGSTALLWTLGRRARPQLLLQVPLLGKAKRAQATADYAFVLASLLGSGSPLPESLRTAAGILQPPFQAAGRAIALFVHRGGELHRAVLEQKDLFGPKMTEQVKIGESTGRLDEMLTLTARLAQDELDRTCRSIAIALSATAFAIAVGVIAWVVLGFWSGHARSLEDIALVWTAPSPSSTSLLPRDLPSIP